MEEVYLLSRPYYFGYHVDPDGAAYTPGVVSFFRDNNEFAAFGHELGEPFNTSVVCTKVTREGVDGVFGFTGKSCRYGVCGKCFTKDHTDSLGKYPIMPLDEIAPGPAEVLVRDFDGGIKWEHGMIRGTEVDDGDTVVLFDMDESEDPLIPGTSGSVVMQNGKIAAVIAGRTEESICSRKMFCTPAEYMYAMLKEKEGKVLE